ncbi:glycerophosphodiester phosphodiesterase [Micromonospora eburnea]|uniref:Glycerophosphoryl diester phosphodiesterase n=1 Tax=Micromonospora eburnea TaxID=227316 RepID=A0A1C6UQS7_9ACTN|nr:glycerophosphodiester phosphodiesterase [Micromonospora eburnea]SCL56404.1 glycerophosphoryl diester phosphodiesterase [Micromonospora eburnea]
MPILVGHRGAPLRRTENTLPSLLLAADLGADAVEFDVRASADGHPILLHDRTLQRFWGDPRTPGETGLAELRALRTDVAGEQIPTVGEVAAAVPLRLVVDNKDPKLVPAVAAELRAAGALERSCFIGEPGVLTVVRAHQPEAEIVLSWVGPELPPAALLDTVRPQALNLRWDSLTEESVERAADLGLRMWTYCIDDADAAARALAWGIDGMISNDLPAVAPVLTPVGT